MTSSDTRFDILGIGTVAVDDLLHVQHYPAPDHKAEVRSKSRQLGGLVATALAAAARLGAKCAYAGVLGDDDLSNAVRSGFASAAIDCTRVVPDPAAGPTHSIIVADDSAGTRNIFYDLSPMRPLPDSAITPELIRSARVLFIDQFGMDAKIKAARIARESGVPIVADMEWPDLPGTPELIPLVDHLILPLHFATAVTGCQKPAEAVRALHGGSGRACTAVTCGARGCYNLAGTEPGEVQHQPAFTIQAVETTGCGDVFHGAYAAALAESSDVFACLCRAAAAAAVYASRPSGWRFLPNPAEVHSLLSATAEVHHRNG